MPFYVVNSNLNRMWRRYGLVNVASNYEGFFLFKFNNEEGMSYVLENGPWLVNGIPLFVSKWKAGSSLGKPELKKLPIWVNLYGVPLEVWNAQGLSELASGIGIPLTLDRATEERCISQSGRVGFARILIEVSADKAIADEVIALVPSLDGTEEKEVIIRAMYNWKPARCKHCNIFGHSFIDCTARPLTDDEKKAAISKEEAKKDQKVGDDGFQTVGRKNRPVQNQVKNVGFQTSKGGGNQQSSNSKGSTKSWVQQRFYSQGQKTSQIGSNPVGKKFNGTTGKQEATLSSQKKGNDGDLKNGQTLNRQLKSGAPTGSSKGSKFSEEGKHVNIQNSSKTMFPDQVLNKEKGVLNKAIEKSLWTEKTKKGQNMGDANFVILKKGDSGVMSTSNPFDVLDQLPTDNDDENDHKWFFDQEAVNFYLERGIIPPADVFIEWSQEQADYYRNHTMREDVYRKDDAPEFMQVEDEDRRRGGERLTKPKLSSQ
ncbi:uncharacterized protein LOC112502655 [Cynara cardunculus var. scolymus]|uniref:uncharacterized protein LOC112502655 n=1 Tax=Cynara cardunculus var. scolymus TaxID=59895 RepID=UPI000D630D54|nr:uncharacterized protein LOC112502655 [Cynara cardunculus var. scolymus]